MLDEAFEALKKYDWGTDMAALAPIDEPRSRPDRESAVGSRIWKIGCWPPSRATSRATPRTTCAAS